MQPNLYASAIEKGFQGIDLTTEEDDHLEIYLRIFGSFAPMDEDEFDEICEGEGDRFQTYEEYILSHLLDIERRLQIIDGYPKIIFIDEIYEAGAIILTDKAHPYFPDTLILCINDEGEQSAPSEGLGINMNTKFLDNRFHFIGKNSITGISCHRHLCANPDCQNCNKLRHTPSIFIPYSISIEDLSGNISIGGGDLSTTMDVITAIQGWLNGVEPRKVKYFSIIEEKADGQD